MRRNQIQLAPQIIDVFVGPRGVFGDDFIAAAVIANRIAKWYMYVQRQWAIERPNIALL